MAFNSFDKLCKAQRDYPKPKFAYAVVEKALKKQPNNAYLLTWKANLGLQLSLPHMEEIAASLERLHQSPVTDTRLLVYMYETCIESLRRMNDKGLGFNSIGAVALGCWQSTAKNMDRKTDRMALWNTLFRTAMQEDCWEDVRVAIVNYNKEGPSDKKQSHYSLIVTTQLAAEQKRQIAGSDDPMANLQYMLALKLMKQAYLAPPNDPIALKDIRDLRFMAGIFKRQNRCVELHDLWDAPPKPLEPVLDLHRQDILTLMTKALLEQEEWPLLEKLCLATIEETLSNTSSKDVPKLGLWELCARRWDLWNALLRVVFATRSKQEGRDFISALMEKCFGGGLPAKDRHARLTYMKLRHHIGELTLTDCKDYFEHYSTLTSCFDDLRPFLCHLPFEALEEFWDFTLARSASMQVKKPADWDNFQQYQLNFMKFQYMMTVARGPTSPQHGVFEALINSTVRASHVWPESSDSASLVIYSLLQFHHRFVCDDEGLNPLEIRLNSRVLLQATMFARHMTEKDKDKQNRTFFLLAARLHLNLGLGTVAFRLYTHTKCKEMLLDTLSPYVLTRISQTHPFDVKGYGGFSADQELARVISTIEKMELKTDGYVFTDVPSFLWDQAADTLELKRKLKSSWTKHLCARERRQIARLKGELCVELPKLDYKTYNNISDNIDRTVFPNFELQTSPEQTLHLVMPNSIPNMHSLTQWHFNKESASKCLYKEGLFEDSVYFDFDPWDDLAMKGSLKGGEANHIHTEANMRTVWTQITMIVDHCHGPLVPRSIAVAGLISELLNNVKVVRKAIEKLRMPGDTTLKLEDEPTMFHENMLIACYGHLEFCRAIGKLVDCIIEKIIKPKGKDAHPWKASLPKTIDTDLLEEGKICFQTVRDVAESYIALLKKRGVAAIKAQVRWGNTGEVLKAVLSDEDVEYYAKEYVDSALEAWGGVLKVKFK